MTVFTWTGGVEVETVRFVAVKKPFCMFLQLRLHGDSKDKA